MNNDALEKEVKRLVHANRYEKGYVCIVDVLLLLGYLTKENYENWRFGRVDYLERVCTVNLSKLTLINKAMVKNASELGLKSSWTAYNKYGKGVKRPLRFSKSGAKTIEERYATHYVDTDRLTELKEPKRT